MNPLVMEELNRAHAGLHDLCRKFGVKRLAIFGSALTGDWRPEKSDLDLLVDFDAPPAGIDLFAQQFVLQVELEKLFGRAVDLVERKAIRKQIFREKVEREARVIYAT